MSEQSADIWSLTPQEATERLAEMTAAHQASSTLTPQSRLNAFGTDADKQTKLAAGDPETRREFDTIAAEIVGMDHLTSAITGDASLMTSGKLREMSAGVQWLREFGFADEVIRDILAGDQVEQPFRARIAQWRSDAMRSAEFVKSYLSGEPEAAKKMMIANAVLIQPVKEVSP
ncbi:hypothetical protein [Bradyrhizobium sp. SZCCHNS3053]|uniref:hypothetical protein n=1 Tax=Bradyrhizobium sp. SZCCHNS3053 TaxID=3057322 RepID=UPI002916B4BE|nr:hypothetical protein [Bradyrhizobium sp. SZCCHNS3053]